MTDQEDASVTEDRWHTAREHAKRSVYLSGLAGIVLISAIALPAVYLTTLTVSGPARYAVTGAWMALLVTPVCVALCLRTVREQQKSDDVVARLGRQMTEAVRNADLQALQRGNQVRRQEFESRLSNALDMADGEPEVIEVIERSLSSTLPDSLAELLLADNSYAHLLRMASASPTGDSTGCGVDSPDRCPAARRALVQRFDDSDALDACPKLRGRPEGAISALCVPVSIMGRAIGVIHATGEQHARFQDGVVHDLGTLAKLAGARIGLLRVMAETKLQASTDSLTGLLNRRAFEERLSAARRMRATLSVAMADLDHFKELNDTYGHESGDRALRLFSRVLSESVRSQDLLCRHGGEEFVIALPGCTSAGAREIFDSLRVRLDGAITVAGLPKFTVSFGVVDAGAHEDLPALVGRADAALFQAKREGRNRVVVHDAAGQSVLATSPAMDVRGLRNMPPLGLEGELPASVSDAELTVEDPSRI